jgi:hypothetical protein
MAAVDDYAILLIVFSSVGLHDEARFHYWKLFLAESLSLSPSWGSSVQIFFQDVLCLMMSIFGTHFVQTFL